MNRVVIDEQGHAEDVHWQLHWHDKEDAHGAIFSHGEEVVLRVDLYPVLVEHEVDVRIRSVAWREDKTVLEAPLNV